MRTIGVCVNDVGQVEVEDQGDHPPQIVGKEVRKKKNMNVINLNTPIHFTGLH